MSCLCEGAWDHGCGVCVRIRLLLCWRPAWGSPLPWPWVHRLPGLQPSTPRPSWLCGRVSFCPPAQALAAYPGRHRPRQLLVLGTSHTHRRIRVGLTAGPGHDSLPSSAGSFLASSLPGASGLYCPAWGGRFFVLHLLWSVKGTLLIVTSGPSMDTLVVPGAAQGTEASDTGPGQGCGLQRPRPPFSRQEPSAHHGLPPGAWHRVALLFLCLS